MSGTSKRSFARVPVTYEAEISAHDIGTVSGRARDISLKGLFFITDEDIAVGTDCHVSIYVGNLHGQVRIDVRGRIARVCEKGIGIEIVRVEGANSFEHLRNLTLAHHTGEEA